MSNESKATTSGGMAGPSERILEASMILAEMQRRGAHVRICPHRPLRGRYEIWVDGERLDVATSEREADERLREIIGLTAEQSVLVQDEIERLRGAP